MATIHIIPATNYNMSSYHSRGRRALHRAAYGGARLLVLAVTFAPTLAGQGAKEVPRRGKASAPAAVTSHVGPARSVLGSLVGTWRFEIWFAGNFAGAPDASGTRVVKALFDDLHLEWTEQVDHSRIQRRGMVGFDLSSDRFFSASISSVASAPELLTGSLDDDQPTITFDAIGASPGVQPAGTSTLAVVDHDHFVWIAQDGAWRGVFTRRDSLP
ncbi:MAG: hypothetical protein DMD61_12950 [Gemmatimonadetes bacterium]|nr:MAG: hypothetical protein DMD61_12950 [Gemmatimonadota bacterium]